MERTAKSDESSGRARRRAALAAAYAQVTTCPRVRLTPTVSIPLALATDLDAVATAENPPGSGR